MNKNPIWQLAWPVIFSNITIPLLGMVDIAVVGHHYPAHVLGAVAIGSLVFDVLFLLFGFLRMSTTGLVAQHPNDASLLYRALLTALCIACVLIVCQNALFTLVCFFMDTTPAVKQALREYFYLRIYASPTTLGNFALIGYFFGRQNTKAPLFLLMLINISAITLDIIFVRYLELGVKGLAVASITAQTLGFAAGLRLVYTMFRPKRPRTALLFDLHALTRLFHLNKDIFIRTLCLMATFAYFTSAGSRLGTTVVAANAILLNMHQFIACSLDGFAIACEVMVGRAIGKKDKQALIHAIKACGAFALLVSLLLSLFYFIAGDALIRLMTSLPNVMRTAHAYLIWIILLPVLSVGGFLLDGVFIGATWSKPMRNTMLFSTLVIYAPSVFLLQPLGNTGLWIAFCLFMLARGISLAWVLSKKLDCLDIAV
jgi:multidrug resistance protein, MATE family